MILKKIGLWPHFWKICPLWTGSATMVSWTDIGQFFKSATNLLKIPRDAYLGVKFYFPLLSPDYHGKSLDHPAR